MNERLALYRDQIRGFWDRFTTRQKMMIGAIAAFVTIALGLYIYFASQPVYVPLYDQRLSEQEIGSIKAELDAQQIPYRITGNGTGIEVPQVQAQDIIVDLASQGIPKEAGISSEIFSNSSGFGITDRQFDVIKKDALQTEIKKMLERVRGVTNAQVILTQPEEGIFVTDEKQESTASVIVDIEPGMRLNEQQIRALYYIVSRSAEKLPIENITITDQYSNPLELSDSGSESGGTLNAYEQQAKIKSEVEKKIQQNLYNLLGTIMGRDKVQVLATVEMNFAKENRVENLVEPVDKENNEGIIISAEKLSKTFSGQGAVPGGAAGTGDNQVPGYPGTEEGGTNSQYEELTDRVNREVNRITRNVTESPYQIKDISISVGVEPVNGATLDDATSENIKNVLRNVVRVTLSDKEVTPEELDQRITVFARPFSGKVVAEEQTGLSPTLLYGAGALALLAIGAVAFVLMRRRRQQQELEEEIPDLPAPRPFEIPELESDENTDDVIVRKQLEKLARTNPDEFVVLLRTWLAED
ncbi:flagellar basal-body MS-ring/collar protein FliF [Brevibacillus dissolubilis]|uniref:flagellar basal-body MS-ring/collar protein FliF n=1 Tax=Brevibacillus dissolubilis TaxID=1844116 RepID=UPI00111715FF|nr:flagellar basal-body MS-ring/collar protein FliF [Brevibacillus dissolubilis]